MPDLVSVVIPIYNVYHYLRRCIDSVCNQTYRTLEIILIDDGSTDGSGSLCEEYALTDARLKVIHMSNSGLSMARNTGIEQSSGKYIVCVDSDDMIHPRMIEKLYYAVIQNNADISFCSHQCIGQEETPIFAFYNSDSAILLSGRDCIKKMYSKSTVVDMVVAWNKMYKRESFQDLRYPANRKHEDEFVTYKIFYPLKKCVYLKTPLYYYRIRENSIMQQKDISKSLDIVDALSERLLFFQEKNEKNLYALTLKKYMDALISAIFTLREMGSSERMQAQKFAKLFRTTFLKKVLFSRIKMVYKLKYMVFILCKKMYAFILSKHFHK